MAEEIVLSFIEERAPRVHPAFGTPSCFDKQRGEYQKRPPYLYALFETKTQSTTNLDSNLKEALDRYQKSPEVHIDFDINTCTWDDVVDEINRARREYDAAGKGKRNVIRNLVRKVGDYSESMSSWIPLIPSDNGMTVLSGGLKVILIATGQIAAIRARILDTFEDIVATLQMAQDERQRYGSNNDLALCAVNLYETLLHAITTLIDMLLEKVGKKLRNAILKGPLTVNKINDVLKPVDESKRAFQTHLQRLRDNLVVDTHDMAKYNESRSKFIHQNTVDANVALSGIKSQAERDHQEVIKALGELAATYGRDAKNVLFRMLMEQQEEKIQKLQQELQIERARTPNPDTSCLMSVDELLELIGTPPMEATTTLERMLRHGNDMDPASQAQPIQLLEHPQFHRWLYAPGPAALLVDGNSDAFASSRISPLTFFTATLILSLAHSRPQTPHSYSHTYMHFFCGQHTASDDPNAGPRSLIRSLITQLLLAHSGLTLEFIASPDRRALRICNVEALCYVFSRCVRSLPREATVFCVIDGVALFERDEWLDQLHIVISMLTALVRDSRAAAVKLLMTSPGRTLNVQRWVDTSERLLLSRDGDGDGDDDSCFPSQQAFLSAASNPTVNPFPTPTFKYIEVSDSDDSS